MKGAIYRKFKDDILIEDLPDPKLVKDGVILKVLATGLCLSDWHGWMGHDADIQLPHVPGHEMVGEVVEIDPAITNFKIGDRVTLPFVGGCGRCSICLSGNPQVCPDQFQPGFTHWGSFAEYVVIHYAEHNLVHLPDSISNATAASLGCRFATSYRGVVQQGRAKENEWVAVFGCGGVGLSAIMIAASKGAKVIAIDKKESALSKAQEIGAAFVIHDDGAQDVIELITTLSDGGVNLTIDAIGHPKVLMNAINALARRGRHVQIGLLEPQFARAKVPMDRVLAYELEILGSHGMAALDYPEMLQLITDGMLNPQLLIDKQISLEESITLLPMMHNNPGSGVKVITSF